MLGARAFGGDALPLFVEFAQTLLGLLIVFVEARKAFGVARGLGRRHLLGERGHALLGRGYLVLNRLRVARRPLLLLLRIFPAALLRLRLRLARRFPARRSRLRGLLNGRLRRLRRAARGLPVVVLGVVAVVVLGAALAVEREYLR